MRYFSFILVVLLSACSTQQTTIALHDAAEPQALQHSEPFCSPEWLRYIEGQIGSRDSQAHGPDLGSEEWQSVIEFKLGLKDNTDIPEKNTPAWCQFIQRYLDEKRRSVSFSCQDTALTAIEKVICKNQKLSELDNQLRDAYKTALEKSPLDVARRLKQSQQAWIKTRDECLRSHKKAACIEQAYSYRIAELQAKYDLIDALGPFFYVCDGRPSDEIIVTFFPTEPPSLLAERAGQQSFMMINVSASGAKYQGINETFWEHQGQAYVIWGANAAEMTCEKMH